jgi:hypothetical protein
MSEPQVISIAITTSAGGAFSAALGRVKGRFLQYRYVPHGSSPLDTGADFDLVGARTGVILIDHSDIGTSAFTKVAKQPTSDVLGAASLYAGAGEPVEDYIWVNEDLTFTVAQGGNVLQGTLHLWFG